MHKFAVELLGGIPFVIAGGYARDKYFNVKPKDVDVVLNYSSFELVMKALADAGIYQPDDPFSPAHALWIIDHGESYAGDNLNGAHIERVITVGETDFIFIKDEIPLDTICDYFDFNINQFMYCPETDNEFYVGKGTYRVLKQLHGDVPDARILKITSKHQELIKHGEV